MGPGNSIGQDDGRGYKDVEIAKTLGEGRGGVKIWQFYKRKKGKIKEAEVKEKCGM